MQIVRSLAVSLFVFTLHVPVTAAPISEADSFRNLAAKNATRLRQLPAFQRAGCDINVIVGPVILRSREPLLKAGDRILMVNSQSTQGASDTPFKLINALSTGDTAHLKIDRNGVAINVNIPCKNAAVEIGARVAALDAAAEGHFAECSDAVSDYQKQFVQSSAIYGLWRACEVYAGHLQGDQFWSTEVTYWTLHLQELKYQPDAIDIERPKFLTTLTKMLTEQQPLLSAEMRRQWKLATGESMEAPGPTPQAIASASIPRIPTRHRSPRISSSSCESGHWVEAVMSDGEIVKLEDGTLWRVDDADTVDSALWVPTTDIVVCDGKLINTEDNETVEARRINE